MSPSGHEGQGTTVSNFSNNDDIAGALRDLVDRTRGARRVGDGAKVTYYVHQRDGVRCLRLRWPGGEAPRSYYLGREETKRSNAKKVPDEYLEQHRNRRRRKHG